MRIYPAELLPQITPVESFSATVDNQLLYYYSIATLKDCAMSRTTPRCSAPRFDDAPQSSRVHQSLGVAAFATTRSKE